MKADVRRLAAHAAGFVYREVSDSSQSERALQRWPLLLAAQRALQGELAGGQATRAAVAASRVSEAAALWEE